MSHRTDQTHPDLASLLAVETAVWQALVDGDVAADMALLRQDFLGVYPSGFAGRAEHAGQLEDGPSVQNFRISQARLVEAGPDHRLLCYRADYRRSGADRDAAMYVSSLWQRDGAGWRNLFSQDTPVGPPLGV